jgi:hypothetical protein
MSESVHVNLSYSDSVVLEEIIFQWPHKMFTFLWLSTLYRGPDLLFEQFWIPFTERWFVPSLIFWWLWRWFSPTCKYCFPIVAPPNPLGTMIWTDLNLHYIRKLSYKYELFWLSGSRENVSMTSSSFCIFVIISPLKRNWLLICTILNSLYSRMICLKFD